MRIHHLTFRGMGPFAEQQQIDFATLGEAGIFLLEGPTGVGKSTIIDAIVFALYGSVASTNGDKARLVSDFRDPAVEPYVEMVFSTSQGTYRVRRSPAHLRPRARSKTPGDLVEQKPTASLQKLREPRDEDGTAIAARPQDVGVEIHRVVGLNQDQFVRTIVLPQGEFSNFLRASSSDRLPILQRIFRTHLYQGLQDRLRQSGRDARAARDLAQASLNDGLQQFRGAVGLDALAGLDGSSDTDAVLVTVNEQLAALDQAAQQAKEACVIAEAAADQTGTALAALDERIARRDELAEAIARRDQLAASAPAIAAHKAALDADARAGRVADVLQRARQAADKHSAAAEALAAARSAAPTELATASPAGLKTASQQIRTTIGALADSVSDEQGVPGKQSRAAQLAADETEASAQVQRLRQRQSELPEERSTADRSLRAAQATAAPLPQLQQRTAAVTDQAAAAVQLPAAIADEDSLRARAQERLLALEAAESVVTRSTKAYRAGIAATLGMDLQDGQPCPACGSLEHPDPARPGADHVTAGDVDAAVAGAASARSELESAQEALNARVLQVRELRTAAGDLVAETAAAAVAAAQAAEQQAVAASEEAQRLQQGIADLDGEDAAVAEEVEEGIIRHERLAADLRAATKELASLQERLTLARDGFPTVADRVTALAERAERCETLRSDHAAVEQASGELTQAREALATALRRESFDDAEQAEQARLSELAREAAQREVAAHSEAAVEVAATLRQPELEGVDPLETIDREPAVHAKQDADRLRKTADAAYGQAQQTCRQAAAHAATVADAAERRDTVGAATESAIMLAALAQGDNRMQIDLATFVLVHRFRSVIEAANLHLTRMSNGRLILESFEESEGRNRRAGLGVRVRDLHTETARSAKSLSGGETFYASLALALGLAEIVTAESGGIELDTLFVDEGFGSLDPDTLDSVMGVLDGLQRNGRVLGLVSHVTEMKERIAERVEVRRTSATGASTLRVVA